MYEKESAVEGETVGGGAYPFVDEPFQGYSHLLDEETGEFPRSTASGLCVYYTGTVRPIGIGSKLSPCQSPFEYRRFPKLTRPRRCEVLWASLRSKQSSFASKRS